DRVRAAGVLFGCVVADAGYGLSAPFRQGLTARGLAWAVGIPRHQKVYPADERGDHRPMLGPGVGAGEQRMLAAERQGTDGPLDDVAVDLDASVVEEQAQALPAGQSVSDRLSELGLLAEELELVAQPRLERVDERPAALLTNLASLVGATATDVAFDAV